MLFQAALQMAAPSRSSAGASDDHLHYQHSETSGVAVPRVACPLADDLLAEQELHASPLPSSLLQEPHPLLDESPALFDADEASLSILALQHRVALLKAIT